MSWLKPPLRIFHQPRAKELKAHSRAPFNQPPLPPLPALPERTDWLRRVVVILCAAGGLGLLSIPFGQFSDFRSEEVLVWGTFLVTLLVAVGGYAIARGDSDNPFVEPTFLLPGYYFVKFGMGAPLIYYWDRYPWHSLLLAERFVTFGIRDNLANACHIIMLGALGFGLGISIKVSGFAQHIPRINWDIDPEGFRRKMIIYTPVPLAISTVLQFIVPVEMLGTVVLFGWILSAMAIVGSYWMFTSEGPERKRWMTYVGVVLLAMLVVGLLSGMVSEFTKPVIMVVWGYLLARKSIPWRVVAPVVCVAFLLVFPWLTLYKYVSWNPATATVEDRVQTTNELLGEIDYTSALELTADRFLARGISTPFPAIFSRYFPAIYPYEEGKSFITELAGLVPRALWEEKPATSIELNRYSIIVGMVAPGTTTSAVFDAVTEYFINFGLPGAFLLSAVHGLYLCLLFQWLVKSASNSCPERGHYIIGAAIFLALFTLNLDFFGFVQLFVLFHVKNIPVWLFIFYLMSRRWGSAPAAALYPWRKS